MDLNNLKKRIKDNFADFSEIRSAYMYGSILSDRFREGKSDIDILFICHDIEKPPAFLKAIRAQKRKIDAKLDINIGLSEKLRIVSETRRLR